MYMKRKSVLWITNIGLGRSISLVCCSMCTDNRVNLIVYSCVPNIRAAPKKGKHWEKVKKLVKVPPPIRVPLGKLSLPIRIIETYSIHWNS